MPSRNNEVLEQIIRSLDGLLISGPHALSEKSLLLTQTRHFAESWHRVKVAAIRLGHRSRGVNVRRGF